MTKYRIFRKSPAREYSLGRAFGTKEGARDYLRAVRKEYAKSYSAVRRHKHKDGAESSARPYWNGRDAITVFEGGDRIEFIIK